MPKVGKQHFPYDEKGMKAVMKARMKARKTKNKKKK